MDFGSFIQHIKQEKSPVFVLGLGISGVETAAFFTRLGVPVVAAERMTEDQYREKGKYIDKVRELQAAGVKAYFGLDGTDILPLVKGAALAVVSPGISFKKPAIVALLSTGVKVVTEFEMGIQLFKGLKGARSVIITGSNGKSTTVSLVDHVLKCAGKESLLCGNVGIPVVANLGDVDKGSQTDLTLVVEASSYQLESVSVLKPDIAAILNISDNHLERHGTIEKYVESKANAFLLQDKSNFAVLNADDERLLRLAKRVKSSVLYFGVDELKNQSLRGVFFQFRPYEGLDRMIVRVGGVEEVLDISGTQLPGLHNRYNIAAACLILRLAGIESAAIKAAVLTFKPLEHRIEPLVSGSGALFFNDSKSTTVASTMAAIEAVATQYPEGSLRLMLGGEAKAGTSWTPLKECLKENGKNIGELIFFGRDGEFLKGQLLSSGAKSRTFKTLEQATKVMRDEVRSKDVILLSPACASFDEFLDFEDRGRKFKKWILE